MFSLLKNKKYLLCLLGFVWVLAVDFLPRSVRSNALWEQVGQRDYFLQLPGTLSVVPEVSGVFVAILILVACGVAFLVKRDSKHVRFWGLSGLSGLGLVVVLFSYLVDYLSRKYSQEIVPVEFTLFIQSAGMQIVLAFGVMASILLTVNAVQKRRMSSVLYLFGILAQYGFLLMWAAPVIIQSLLLCVLVWALFVFKIDKKSRVLVAAFLVLGIGFVWIYAVDMEDLALWRSLFRDYLYLGAGIGSFEYVAPFYKINVNNNFPQPLVWLVELGLLRVMLLGVIFTYFIKDIRFSNLFNLKNRASLKNSFGVMAFSMIVFALVGSPVSTLVRTFRTDRYDWRPQLVAGVTALKEETDHEAAQEFFSRARYFSHAKQEIPYLEALAWFDVDPDQSVEILKTMLEGESFPYSDFVYTLSRKASLYKYLPIIFKDKYHAYYLFYKNIYEDEFIANMHKLYEEDNAFANFTPLEQADLLKRWCSSRDADFVLTKSVAAAKENPWAFESLAMSRLGGFDQAVERVLSNMEEPAIPQLKVPQSKEELFDLRCAFAQTGDALAGLALVEFFKESDQVDEIEEVMAFLEKKSQDLPYLVYQRSKQLYKEGRAVEAWNNVYPLLENYLN